MNKNMLKMMLLALVASVAVASQAEAACVNHHRAQQVVVRVDAHRAAHHADRHHCHDRRYAHCHCRFCEERRHREAHRHCCHR